MSGVQDLSGSVLKGYHLGDCLGWTSHTAVYRAVRGGVLWAVKVIDSQLEPDGALAARLRRDAGLLSDIGRPFILPIHDAGRSGKFTFAASPLIHAQTLQDRMSGGDVDTELAWGIVRRLADALDKVHSHGLVCRGLKPAHILVIEDNIYLAEFGVVSARVGQLALSAPTYDLSLPQYIAPEQVEGGEPDWLTDIYALAVLIFELLTRTSLRDPGLPSETLKATLRGRTVSAHEREPTLPRSIDRLLGRAMARDPGERPRSAWELLDELVGLPDDDVRPTRALAVTTPAATPMEGEVHPAGHWDAPPVLPAPVPSDMTYAAEPAEVAALLPAPAAGVGMVQTTGPFGGAGPAPAPQKAPMPDDSIVAMLKRMGMPAYTARHDVILNSYFAALMRFAAEACGTSWPEVLAMAGVEAYLGNEPPDDGNRTAPVRAPSQLTDGIEAVFGAGATEILRQWGRMTASFWMKKTQQLQEGDVTYLKPLRLMSPAHVKVADTLYVFARNVDRIRGEPLTTWKQVDKRQFWLVQYDNLTALGRRRPAKSCYFWTAALEAALRWGGLANDWVVDEAECGCVTGTYDCVFTVQQVRR